MEPETLIHDRVREQQRIHLRKGTYNKLLTVIMQKEIITYSKYTIIFAISLCASYVHVGRLAEVAFQRLYMEHVDIAIIYYLLRPNVKHIIQMMGGANIFWCIVFTNMGKECNIICLAVLFTICSSFRWYGYIIAVLQLFFSYLIRDYLEATNPYCLGAVFSGLVGVYICRPLPFGLEDLSLIYVVYMNGLCYSDIKLMRSTSPVEVLVVTVFWMIIKSVAMGMN